MKKIVLSMAIGMSFFGVSMCFAADPALFIAKCGACHAKGAQAAPINPADKAGAVWTKYFERGRHPVDISSISAGDLAKIIEFLVAGAADSEKPAAAVIPK